MVSVLADELLSYVLTVALEMVLVTILFHFNVAVLCLETLTLSNLGENSSHYFKRQVILLDRGAFWNHSFEHT